MPKSDFSISVIAPGFKIPESDLEQCLLALEELKINYQVQKPLFKDSGLCSNTTQKRWSDLSKALKSKNEYIWCLRGGYGCLHLVENLLKFPKPKTKSKLIGFSDITALHYILNQKWNWPTLHWKHLNGFLQDGDSPRKFDLISFKSALQQLSNDDHLYFNQLKPLNSKAKSVQNLKGKIVGGNLITLQSLVGLKIPKPKNKFLFLEEIDEPIYKLDRAFIQLEMNGWFKDLKGLLLGSFTHKNDEIQKETALYLAEKFKDYKIPVFANLTAGHTPLQKPLFLNTTADLSQIKKDFVLKIQNGFKS